MGYSLPAAIGAALYQPDRQVICCIGDGGMQLNIQELQTLRFHNLNVKIFVFHNFGYGIIKQFQDQYFDGRYAATGTGYSAPDFCKVAAAYGIPATRVTAIDQLDASIFDEPGPAVVELVLHPNTWIEPKLVMGHSIEDQFPYLSDADYESGMRFSGSRRPTAASRQNGTPAKAPLAAPHTPLATANKAEVISGESRVICGRSESDAVRASFAPGLSGSAMTGTSAFRELVGANNQVARSVPSAGSPTQKFEIFP